MYDAFFAQGQRLRAAGVPFAVAIVVRADAPTSAKPGDKAIITQDGTMHGWIGGSCTQPTVVAAAQRMIAEDRCQLIRLCPDAASAAAEAGIEVRTMTCYSGGTLDIYIEAQQPQPRLIIVGNLATAQALAQLGKAMSFRVIAIDPAGSEAMAHADEVLAKIGAISTLANPLTAIVVATHGLGDQQALEIALRSPAPYVGLIASPKRAGELRRSLAEGGLRAEEIARLESPAGLDIGARRGDEIALSILAEIVQRRRAAERLGWPTDATECGAQAKGNLDAVDPICGMRVVVAGARYVVAHEGSSYFFCCAGCQRRFEEDPAAALATKSEA